MTRTAIGNIRAVVVLGQKSVNIATNLGTSSYRIRVESKIELSKVTQYLPTMLNVFGISGDIGVRGQSTAIFNRGGVTFFCRILVECASQMPHAQLPQN